MGASRLTMDCGPHILKFMLGIELNAKGKVFWSVGHVMALEQPMEMVDANAKFANRAYAIC